MIFTMAQILNYIEKQRFMVYNMYAFSILTLVAVIMNYMLPQYEMFYAFLIWFTIFMIAQSFLFASIGNYGYATATINGVELEDLHINNDKIKED